MPGTHEFEIANITHQYQYAGVRGGILIDRGDFVAAIDFDLAPIGDTNWHDLDLSAIIPVGAYAVVLLTIINHTLVGAQLQFRQNGNVNGHNMSADRTVVASVSQQFEGYVACDANRIIEYRSTTSVNWTTVLMRIRGWYI